MSKKKYIYGSSWVPKEPFNYLVDSISLASILVGMIISFFLLLNIGWIVLKVLFFSFAFLALTSLVYYFISEEFEEVHWRKEIVNKRREYK